jgi:chemotaxis protein MotA
MLSIVGFVLVIVLVFGGYVLAGGKFAIIVHAIPFEGMMIGGAALGTFLVANGSHVVKGALGDLRRVVSGPHWRRQDYQDLLTLMYLIVRLLKARGVLALEAHVEHPEESALLGRFPRIRADHFALAFIADTIRMMTMNLDDPFQVEECMQRQIRKHHAELHARAAALQAVADAMPALGIVAAVLGVVKTMASINAPVEILGAMIGGALVGTFLGVLLSYCFVGPVASKLLQIVEADQKPFALVKTAIIAHAQGLPTQVAVELARRMTPSSYAPSFNQLEDALDEAKDQLSAAA